MNVSEVMTSDIDTCTPESSLNEVAAKMRELNVGVIPISENGTLLGVVTDRDLAIKGLADNLQADSKVSKVMNREVITGTKDMCVEEAANIMAAHQIRRLPIVEKDQLVGIVSLGDLAVHNQTKDKAGKALENISFPASPIK